jgi:hypothetical protein
VSFTIDQLLLMPGTYRLDLWLGDAGGDFDVVYDAISFDVAPADLLGSGRLPPPDAGVIFRDADWSICEGHTRPLPAVEPNGSDR